MPELHPISLPQPSSPHSVCEERVGRGEANLKWLSGSVVSGQKPLPSRREKPMAHLRLGAGASGIQIKVRLQDRLGPPCFSLSPSLTR